MRRELGMLVTMVLLCGALYWSNPNFLSERNALNNARQISMYGIMAIGMAFVIITGGIDLSAGSVIGLTGIIIAKVSSDSDGGAGHPLWMGIGLALFVALLIGTIQGLLITRLKLQPFIVTLGFMLMLRGISQTLVHGGNISFSHFSGLANNAPLLLAMLIVVALVAAYLLHFTVFGRYVFALGGNRGAAQYSGIPVQRVEMITYIISAGLAGVSGVCWASYIGQMTHMVGATYELTAIAACVLGGCSLTGGEGSIVGVLIGTSLMQVIGNGLNMFELHYKDALGRPQLWKPDDNSRNIVIGAVILLAVILDQLVHLAQQRRRTRAVGKSPSGGAPVESIK